MAEEYTYKPNTWEAKATVLCLYSSTYHQLGFLLWLNLVENEGYVFFMYFLCKSFWFFTSLFERQGYLV